MIKSLASKMRKALVIATSAAVALTGLTAMPASAADATYAADNAYAYRSANAMIQASNNEVTIPAGVMSVNFDVQFTLGADFFTNNAGKKITLKRTVKGPDGAVLSTGYYVGGEPSFRFCPANNQCDYSTWDKAELTVKNTHTSGSISVYAYASRQSEMMNMSRPDPLTPGKYTINAVIQADGVDVAVDEVQANIVTSRSSGSYSMEGETVSPAAGVSELNVSIQMCVDSTKIAVGDVLTPEIYVNDVKKTINGGSARFYNRDGSTPNPRMGGNVSSTATVTQTDIDYGLSAGANTYQGGVTSGATYVLKGKVVDQDGNDVTGNCAPTTPAKPTLSAQGQDLNVIPGATKFAEAIECEFYASNDLTKVLRTVMAMSNMPNSPKSCNYYSAPSGITYVVKTVAYYYGFASAESEVSNAVLIAAPGYTVSPAVSGGDNGGEVSVVSNAVNAVSGAMNVNFLADATSALRLSVTSQSTSCPPCGPSTFTATLEKTTSTGLSSTFAGTGSATLSTAGAGFPQAAWYGAGDKWTLAGVNVTFGAQQPTSTYKVLQGTYGAAATTPLEVASSVFESTCASLGAGYTAKPSPQSTSFVITPIAAPTAKQLFSLNCYKPTVLTSSTMNLANPVLVTIDNATTVTVVKALGENSNVANAANTAFSASTSATGTATALTIFVTKRLVTDSTVVAGMTTETGSIASREIVRLAADLTSTTTLNGWVTSGTSLATEPTVVVPRVNDGSFYAMQRLATDFKLMKVSATGAASTAIAITNDKATDMANYSLGWPTGLQSGSLANVSIIAATPTKTTVLSVNTTTGAGKASEIVSYVVSQGMGLTNGAIVDPATKDVYWWFSNTAAEAGKIGIYKWRDPLYVKPVGPVPAVTSKNLEYATNTPAAGTKVTFTGTNLNLATAVKFGTVAATLGTKTATSLEVTVPAGVTGTVAITIESANGNAAGGNFTYVGANKVAQTVTLDAGANTAAVGDADRTLSATVAMTGYTAVASLTYSSTTAAVCTVTGNKLKFVGKGTCSVKATQAGSSWTAEGVATKDITVTGPDAQTITVKAPSTGEKLVGLDGYFIYPSTNSGLPLSIRFDTPTVCKKGTFAANHVINVKTGTCKITVLGAGSAQWMAGSTVLTYTVGKAGTTAITDAGNVTAPVVLNNNGTKTNVLSEVVSWKKSTGALTVSSRGVWVGPITATATFTVSGKKYTCTLNYGTLKAAAATSVKGFPATTALCGGKSTSDKAALAALKSISAPVTVKIVVVRDLRDPAKYTVKGQKVTRAVYVTIG